MINLETQEQKTQKWALGDTMPHYPYDDELRKAIEDRIKTQDELFKAREVTHELKCKKCGDKIFRKIRINYGLCDLCRSEYRSNYGYIWRKNKIVNKSSRLSKRKMLRLKKAK